MKTITLAAILALWSTIAAAEDFAGIPVRFFEHVTQGEMDEAVELLAANPWVGRNSDQILNLKAELAKLLGMAGDYRYHELIAEGRAGSRYAHQIYVVGYERQPVRFELKLYKPGGDWLLYGFSFDPGLTADIETLTNQRLAE